MEIDPGLVETKENRAGYVEDKDFMAETHLFHIVSSTDIHHYARHVRQFARDVKRARQGYEHLLIYHRPDLSLSN